MLFGDKSRDFPDRIFLKHKSRVTCDRCGFIFLRFCVDGKHLAEWNLRRGGPELGSFCYFILMCFLWGGGGGCSIKLLFLIKFLELGAKSDRTFTFRDNLKVWLCWTNVIRVCNLSLLTRRKQLLKKSAAEIGWQYRNRRLTAQNTPEKHHATCCWQNTIRSVCFIFITEIDVECKWK